MEFNRLIDARNSVRKYAGAPTHEEIVSILRMAQRAPSWKNMQASRCYVAERAETIEAVRRALPSFNQNSSAGAALIVTTFVRDQVGFSAGKADNEVGNGWGAYDLGLRDAYLVLAASDIGLDTLIMGIRDADAIRVAMGIPENEQIMSVIAVGRRAGDVAPKPRKPLDDVAKFI